jgi:hypothetical protein
MGLLSGLARGIKRALAVIARVALFPLRIALTLAGYDMTQQHHETPESSGRSRRPNPLSRLIQAIRNKIKPPAEEAPEDSETPAEPVAAAAPEAEGDEGITEETPKAAAFLRPAPTETEEPPRKPVSTLAAPATSEDADDEDLADRVMLTRMSLSGHTAGLKFSAPKTEMPSAANTNAKPQRKIATPRL